MLFYFMRVQSTKVLGFGDRCAIWTSGCSKNPPCKGCLVSKQHETEIFSSTAQEMTDWILDCQSATGITISGGEPFDQAPILADIIEKVKNQKGGSYSVIIYTGRLYEDLLESAKTDVSVRKLLSTTDVLIDGPYIEELDDNVPYRGSSNQRIIVLNSHFYDMANNYYTSIPGRKIELSFRNSKALLVGVPSHNQLSNWKSLINDNLSAH